MTKITYYINNVQVDASTFYDAEFSDTEIDLLLEGVLVRRGDNDYRIFVEDNDMKYDNRFYRSFNKKNNNNKKEDKTMKKSYWEYVTDEELMAYLGVDINAKKYYIAYGSNLNKAQMINRCPHAKARYTGLLNGWELFYAGSKSGNYATIRKCEGKAVPVAVWEIDGLDEYYLDMYEGYPTFYFKDTIKFRTNEGEKEAMVYIMRKDAEEGMPSIYYEKVVRQGYKDFGFDETYLDDSIIDCMHRTMKI